jgi:putative ABC transport system permease protein
MLFVTIVKSALKSLWGNKLRSFLAMLGIIIGVGAVIAMLAIGTGTQQDVLSRIQTMGTNRLSIRPGQGRTPGGVRGDDVKTLTVQDADALLAIQGVNTVAPMAQGSAQLKYLNNNTRSRVVGTAVTYLSSNNFQMEHGRFFTDSEADRNARVVVLGSEAAATLELTRFDIGKPVKVNGLNFEFIGMLKSKGGDSFFSADDMAIVPYTTAMNILFGMDHLSGIEIQAKDSNKMKQVEEAIAAELRKRHKITNPDEDDFEVRNQADIIETMSGVTKTFTYLLGGIAAISLLVGGIGIMNIMLVTVTERTREIGIRKAIGARDRDILQQFLLESLIMSALGGLIGMAAGIGAAVAIGRFSQDFNPVVTAQSVLLAIGFSAGVGIFFGFYPAWRAAQLKPIECLYYE